MTWNKRPLVGVGILIVVFLFASCDDSSSSTNPSANEPAPPAQPSFSPVGGSFDGSVVVKLTPSVEGAEVFYTTDSSVPTTSSKRYTSPIPVYSTTLIRAVTVQDGKVSSARGETFQVASVSRWNDTIQYGYLTDSRDGRLYRTVKIGAQTWMAENLNFKGPGADSGWCYNDSAVYCAQRGRLYKWASAMAGSPTSTSVPSGVRGLCPEGTHVPSDAEWAKLVDFIGGETRGMSKLKAKEGWSDIGGGADTYGFRAIPAGERSYTTLFEDLNDYATWWTSTDNGAPGEFTWTYFLVGGARTTITRLSTTVERALSVRCVKD